MESRVQKYKHKDRHRHNRQTEREEVERKEILADANGIDNDAQCSSINSINQKILGVSFSKFLLCGRK